MGSAGTAAGVGGFFNHGGFGTAQGSNGPDHGGHGGGGSGNDDSVAGRGGTGFVALRWRTGTGVISISGPGTLDYTPFTTTDGYSGVSFRTIHGTDQSYTVSWT